MIFIFIKHSGAYFTTNSINKHVRAYYKTYVHIC